MIKVRIWCAGDIAFRVVDVIHKAEQRVRGETLADADEEDRTQFTFVTSALIC